ncbi:universal stress protein [Stratiformator vulcanicus]|uniref:Universal stress protein family protein n=1 Tax=Stratiformator vulcanicus TaxID=2527980 RepID=A0A517R7T2_9PLAN|nr:universal stress protein [Stratiformator vulcanicus]QDT39925.1 Universal stress protein family protein [Stratiformator vulcanicus]
MFDPNNSDLDRSVRDSIDLFQKARVGDAAPVKPRVPKSVLVVIDGSTQDGTSIGFARTLKEQFDCKLGVVDARESYAENDVADGVAAGLEAQTLSRTEGDSYEQILAAVEKSGCDFLIVPCPYGRDLNHVGADSAGTVIDVLLSRSPVPLLVVREPYEVGQNPFRSVILVLIGENAAAPDAAALATGLTRATGDVELVLLLEEEFYENFRDIFKALNPESQITREQLVEALQKEHLRLHQSLLKSSAEVGFTYRMEAHGEGDPELNELDADQGHPLVVLALEHGDHASEGHVADRVRRSKNPLLIVPTARAPKPNE